MLVCGVGGVRGSFVEFLQFFWHVWCFTFFCSQSGNLSLLFSLLEALYYEILRDLCLAFCAVLCDVLVVQFFTANISVLIMTLSLFILH